MFYLAESFSHAILWDVQVKDETLWDENYSGSDNSFSAFWSRRIPFPSRICGIGNDKKEYLEELDDGGPLDADWWQ